MIYESINSIRTYITFLLTKALMEVTITINTKVIAISVQAPILPIKFWKQWKRFIYCVLLKDWGLFNSSFRLSTMSFLLFLTGDKKYDLNYSEEMFWKSILILTRNYCLRYHLLSSPSKTSTQVGRVGNHNTASLSVSGQRQHDGQQTMIRDHKWWAAGGGKHYYFITYTRH